MADLNNFTEITENFDTIKTLLNSIRAQGILNTSDVDKLLSGINSKLEKINTEEDIDLIKIFLSELKQNLDERHSVLLSKFGAIESLFSNLLKNSSEALKSNEVKELFDIVATNLSVFSREVVSQKETLSDITLRLDALRSDDSQKKEIIKNISVLKNDVDKVTNGFDSIVLNLNENFKAVVNAISEIDPTENVTKFGKEISDISNSFSTVLSALQLLDKKNLQIEDAIKGLATRDDLISTKKWISDLAAHEQKLTESVDGLADKYYKIDNLADKIDASVDIIAGLKTVISDNNDRNLASLIDKLNELENIVTRISSDDAFETFKASLEGALKNIFDNSVVLQNMHDNSSQELQNIKAAIQALDINTHFKELASDLAKTEQNIREHVSVETEKVVQLVDVNTTRALNEIAASADSLSEKLFNAQNMISSLCAKNFEEVEENIAGIKVVVSQIDENNVSANNAIFSNITDRLAIFENSLKKSMDKQEESIEGSVKKLFEQMSNIKELSGVLDYKMDASVIEFNNAKVEFSGLKSAVEDVLALDFVNNVKDLKVDLYAIKQELSNSIDTSSSELADKLSNDLFGKYELLISKLESSEIEFKQLQANTLSGIKEVLDNIMASIMDVLSYVSDTKDTNIDAIDAKLDEITRAVNDNTYNYVEAVREVVDVIRTQVDNDIRNLNDDANRRFDALNSSISADAINIRNDIKLSYEKLQELQDSLDDTNNSLLSNINGVLETTDNLKTDFDNKLTTLKTAILQKVTDFQQELTCANADNLSEFKFASEAYHSKNVQAAQELSGYIEERINDVIANVSTLEKTVNSLSDNTTASLSATLAKILDNFVSLKALLGSFNDKNAEEFKNSVEAMSKDFSVLRDKLELVDANIDDDLTRQFSLLESNFEILNKNLVELFTQNEAAQSERFHNALDDISESVRETVVENLSQYKTKVETLFDNISEKNAIQAGFISEKVVELNTVLNKTLEEQNSITSSTLSEIAENMKQILNENTEISAAGYEDLRTKLGDFLNDLDSKNNTLVSGLKTQLDDIAKFVDSGLEVRSKEINDQFNAISVDIKEVLEKQNSLTSSALSQIAENMKQILNENTEVSAAEYEDLRTKLGDFLNDLDTQNNTLVSGLKTQLDDIAKLIRSSLDVEAKDVNEKFNVISLDIKALLDESSEYNSAISQQVQRIYTNIEQLYNQIQLLFENNSLNIVTQLNNNSSKYLENLEQKASEFKNLFDALNNRLDKDEISRLNVFQSQLEELSSSFKTLIEETKTVSKVGMAEISETLINSGKKSMEEIETSIDDKVNSILAVSADISAAELQTMENFANKIIEQIKLNHQTITACQDLITNMVKADLDSLACNIEKETDVIVKELLEEVSMLKDCQKDEMTKFALQVENAVEDCIYNNISELKSYFDIKSDSSVLNTKLDNIGIELNNTAESILAVSSKLLEASVFDEAVADMKNANEVIISSMAETLNKQIQEFITTNISADIKDKFVLFDKKFTDAVVDKYEEIKLISTKYNDSFVQIEASVKDSVSSFAAFKDEINKVLTSALEGINKGIDDLTMSFASLKAQLLDKSGDASLSKQIGDIENLVREQFEHLEDISELCCTNLPELTELNTIVKYNVLNSLNEVSTKLNSQDENLAQELSTLKTDVITQFLNIFNQISFVTEQEEILDFIQAKHSELITILSHIVTTVDGIDTIAVVDNKVDSLKEDIDLINEKITSIISSDGDIDYVYSLQDLESDIAGLRLSLNEVKESNKSKELEALIASTNDIYSLVKDFDSEGFKKDFDALNEDIVSISTRTNKLILASDESYKTLQENLQDFKLVINDLDERTRNFAQESGLNRIDNKLGVINTMINNGAKTNQVFNQVFEYLAEWVDNAGAQIAAISDKVETLDDIGQIKVMLEDLKAEAEDDSDSVELIEALGNVFDKQAKRIASLEAKLDRVIVETTISNKQNKIDMSPIEETLNRFLVAIGDKMSSQQDRINSLESKLDDVISNFDPKDTAQLTKKVGGMDRQIAKLNKSIEKIASHVVEK